MIKKNSVRTATFVFAILGLSFFIYQFISNQLNTETESKILNDEYEQMREGGIPSFESKSIDGQDFELKPSQDHKVLVINFWASWCGPCIDEFPSMMKMIRHFKGQVGLIAVSLDANQKEMTDFLDVYKARQEKFVTLLWDPEYKAAEKFGTEKLPESYIVTGDLKLVKKVAGSIDWMSPQILDLLQSSL